MKCAAVISEFNPFHRGHEALFSSVRQTLGSDTLILAIMSGNFVQRGEPAIYEKHARAAAAVVCGADIVLELPFPWSSSSANRFASGAVSLIERLNAVDYLCFGSESGNLDELKYYAASLADPAFEQELDKMSGESFGESFIKLRSDIFEKRFGKKLPEKSNDILGTEYLGALLRSGSSIETVAFKRDEGFSATASRSAIRENNTEEVSELIPEAAQEIFNYADTASFENNGRAVLSFFRLSNHSLLEKLADMPVGLAESFISAANKTSNIKEFFDSLPTKIYTSARLRRCILYCMLGVNNSALREAPSYTVLLAASERGVECLRKMTHDSSVPLLNKQAHYVKYGDTVDRQFNMSLRADGLFALMLNKPQNTSFSMNMKPFLLTSFN